MHHSRIYSPRNGAILCHYLNARRAVNCPATNVATYFKFAAFLLLLLAVVSVCLQERKGSIALGCPPAGWCGWGLKRGWKNGKCLTNGAVNAAVGKLIWMHHTTWNRKRNGKWHSQTWSERNSFHRQKGLGWGQKRQQIFICQYSDEDISWKTEELGFDSKQKKRFLSFMGRTQPPLLWVAAISSRVYSSWCLHLTSHIHVVRSSRIYNTTPLYESTPWYWPV